MQEVSLDTGYNQVDTTSELNDEADTGLPSIAVHFIIVGVLFVLTLIVGAIYFYLHYAGGRECRRCMAQLTGNDVRIESGSNVSTISGWMARSEVRRGGGGGGGTSTGGGRKMAVKLKPTFNSRL